MSKTTNDVTSIILVCIFAIIGISILMALPTFFLWNWLMPTIFGLPQVTFWQALGLNLLTGILLKNTGSSK